MIPARGGISGVNGVKRDGRDAPALFLQVFIETGR
jgi:hypothetical protein